MIEEVYRCNLCGERREKKRLIGITKTEDNLWTETDPDTASDHICARCICALQSNIHQRCISGFICSGGLECHSSHK